MDKEAAKALTAQLRSSSYRYFAFAPNGEHPALVVDTKMVSAGTFKTRCASELGVAYRSGSIFVGEIAHDAAGVVFVVDTRISSGEVNAPKAILGLRKLRKQLGDLGQRPPALAKIRVRVGDGDEVDETTAPGLDPAEAKVPRSALDALPEQIAGWEARARAVEAEAATADQTRRAALVQALHTLRDEIKLAASQVEAAGSAPEPELAGRLQALRLRVYALLDRVDPERAEERAALDKEFYAATPIASPADLPTGDTTVGPPLARLNALLRGEADRSPRAIVRAAQDLAQACVARAAELRKRPKDKVAVKALFAVLAVQREAEDIAAALQAQAAFRGRARDVQQMLSENESARAIAGINNARLVKDEDGKVRYVAKTTPLGGKKFESKAREFGKEVTSGAVAGELCDVLGLPRMVTPTVPVIVATDDGPCLAAVQDAWEGRGDLGERYVHTLDIRGTKLTLSITEAEAIYKAGDTAARRAKARAVLGTGLSDEVADELIVRMEEKSWRPKEMDTRPIPVDDAALAEDIAATAIVDLVTGQRDHKDGKEDNMMLVQTPGGVRVRPIDYGMALPGIKDPELDDVNFGAWSKVPAAAVPMRAELLDGLLALDPDTLVSTAVSASVRAANATRVPAMRIRDDQLEILKLQTVLLKEAAKAAKEADARVSARDLADLFSTAGKRVLSAVRVADRDGKRWRDLLPDQVAAFRMDAAAWAKATVEIEKVRTALASELTKLRADLARLDAGEKVDAEALAAVWVKASNHLGHLRPLVDARPADRDATVRLTREIDALQERIAAL